MTSARDRRASARAHIRRGDPSASALPTPPGVRSSVGAPTPGNTTPARVLPPSEPPDRSVATASDTSLVILPPSGASATTTTTDTPWSTVVIGTPHSASARSTAVSTPPPLPQATSHGGFSILAESESMPDATVDAPQAPPRPLDFADFEFLLEEITELGNNRAEDWKIQNDRHVAYLARMQSLDATISKQTTIASGLMSAVSTLRDQLDSTRAEAVEANDLAYAVQTELRTLPTDPSSLASKFDNMMRAIADLRASIPTASPPTPSHTDIPAALASTQAAVLDSLASMVDDVAQHMDHTIRTHHAHIPTGDTTHDPPSPTRWTNANRARWRNADDYDSDAAYAAAHTPPSRGDTPVTTEVRLPRHRPDFTDDDLSPRYGTTPSPRQRTTLLKDLDPDILLWHAGLPGGDPIDGADLLEEHDVEALGIASAFATEMAEDHLEFVEHWDNPRWTSYDARHYGNSKYTPSSLSGPPVGDIIKQIASWDPLSDLSATGWQAFYKKLRRHSFKWKISLVPFEAISLKYESMGHNLCHCGLGLTRFRKMGDALFIILENLLPSTNTTIATALETLANSPRHANGYELLWTLLKEFIPMLDRTKPTPFPSWSDAADIFQYARLVLMYCDLARHHGPPYTEAMKSRMFLMHVRGSYVQLSTQYNAIISSYCPGRDGITRCSTPLPRHLTVLELARTLHDEMLLRNLPPQSTQPMAIQAYRTSTSTHDHTPDLASITSPMSSVTNPATTTPHALPARPTHIQGYAIANLARRQQPTSTRSAPNPTGRPPPSQRYEGTCAACGKYGHEAVRCDMLAMALFLKRYASDRGNQATIRDAETRWKERNKKHLPRDDRSPRTILANYCTELNFTEDSIDDELDWGFLSTSASDCDFVE